MLHPKGVEQSQFFLQAMPGKSDSLLYNCEK